MTCSMRLLLTGKLIMGYIDIKKLTLKERASWIILDDQFFTFANLSKVYSIEDIMKLA